MQISAGRDDRLAAAGLGLAIIGLGILGLGGLVLAWDGAWFVVRTLETGTPTFLHGRLIGWVVQAPLIVARRLTDDPAVFAAIAGLVYAAVPAVALLATWRITRPDRDDLMALAVLGIGVASLGGIAFLISEAMMAVALGWPLVVAASLGRLRRHRWLAVGLVAALAVTHPFGVVILAMAAIAVGVRAADHPDERRGARRVIVALALVGGLIGLRYLAFGSGYEGEATDIGRLGAQFRGGLAGAPLFAAVAAVALGLVVVARPRRERLGAAVVAVAGVVIGLVMVDWAMDPARWERGLMFRTFVLIATLPLYLLAVVAARRPPATTSAVTGTTMIVAGAVLIGVATAQTLAWRLTMDELRSALAAEPAGCVDAARLPLEGSALDHWGVTALGMLVEGRAPAHLIAYGLPCAMLDAEGGVPLKVVDGVVVDRAPARGWFDLRPIDQALTTGTDPATPPP